MVRCRSWHTVSSQIYIVDFLLTFCRKNHFFSGPRGRFYGHAQVTSKAADDSDYFRESIQLLAKQPHGIQSASTPQAPDEATFLLLT